MPAVTEDSPTTLDVSKVQASYQSELTKNIYEKFKNHYKVNPSRDDKHDISDEELKKRKGHYKYVINDQVGTLKPITIGMDDTSALSHSKDTQSHGSNRFDDLNNSRLFTMDQSLYDRMMNKNVELGLNFQPVLPEKYNCLKVINYGTIYRLGSSFDDLLKFRDSLLAMDMPNAAETPKDTNAPVPVPKHCNIEFLKMVCPACFEISTKKCHCENVKLAPLFQFHKGYGKGRYRYTFKPNGSYNISLLGTGDKMEDFNHRGKPLIGFLEFLNVFLKECNEKYQTDQFLMI